MYLEVKNNILNEENAILINALSTRPINFIHKARGYKGKTSPFSCLILYKMPLDSGNTTDVGLSLAAGGELRFSIVLV